MTFRVPEFHFFFLFYFFYVEAYFAVTLFSAFSYHIIKLRQTFSPLLLAPPAPKSTFQECLNSFVKMRAKVKQKTFVISWLWRRGAPDVALVLA